MLASCSEFGHSFTAVSAIKTVFPLFTTKFSPKIISPGLAFTTVETFLERPNIF